MQESGFLIIFKFFENMVLLKSLNREYPLYPKDLRLIDIYVPFPKKGEKFHVFKVSFDRKRIEVHLITKIFDLILFGNKQ